MNWLNHIPQGTDIAVVGGGGKSGLIERLEAEFSAAGRPALVTVTTRLCRRQFPHLERVEAENAAEAEAAAVRAGRGERLLLAGPGSAENLARNKFSGLPPAWFPRLRQIAGPGLTFLVEADGSAGLPLKAHRPDEPVLPPGRYGVIGVVGLSVLRRPWPEAVHRPELVRDFIDPPPRNAPLAPAQVADFIVAAWRRFRPDLIFLNQLDALTPAERVLARELAGRLTGGGYAVLVGSVAHNVIDRG